MASGERSERGIGPVVRPDWWDFLRQVVMFALGVALIIYAAVSPGHDIPFIVTGLVLLGLVPIDTWLTRRTN